MKFIVYNLKVSPSASERVLKIKIAKETRLDPRDFSYHILRRSIDSRKNEVSFIYSCVIETEHYVTGRNVKKYIEPAPIVIPSAKLGAYRPVVVGFGPAGMFAALLLARAGLRPIVLERGKPVEKRALDVIALKKHGILDPESNVCYGEGGAGTFSDGKLNTGVTDDRVRFVLEEFVKHGAKKDILIDALPHIGSDYLQNVVKSFREEIVALGGDILFESRLTGLTLSGTALSGITYLDSAHVVKTLSTDALFLALGHSPFDTATLLAKSGLLFAPKDFSIGVRIEHLQKEIDEANYHHFANSSSFPPSSYRSVVHLPSGRSVYSFCMCPGGYVVNSSSSLSTVVTNGMSNNARDATNGNAAILVNVRTEDYFHGDPLDGFRYREALEKVAFREEKPYFAPAETVKDFLAGNEPHSFGKITPSYEPGVYLNSLAQNLPAFIADSLREALPIFAHNQAFFSEQDAVLTGYETRSSSPVRIPRNERGEANITGVYPLGEGASYAGGITSAALDGLKIAFSYLESKN